MKFMPNLKKPLRRLTSTLTIPGKDLRRWRKNFQVKVLLDALTRPCCCSVEVPNWHACKCHSACARAPFLYIWSVEHGQKFHPEPCGSNFMSVDHV
uniref:Uncharacterized protein n=1 Tax=Arundo donax TaxID=35708 RepID=A0A0A9H2T9_ARUDO